MSLICCVVQGLLLLIVLQVFMYQLLISTLGDLPVEGFVP